MRRPGELCVREAAAHLEVHERTVRRWAQAALAGEPSQLSHVRRDITKHYWIDEQDVRAILSRDPSEVF